MKLTFKATILNIQELKETKNGFTQRLTVQKLSFNPSTGEVLENGLKLPLISFKNEDLKSYINEGDTMQFDCFLNSYESKYEGKEYLNLFINVVRIY